MRMFPIRSRLLIFAVACLLLAVACLAAPRGLVLWRDHRALAAAEVATVGLVGQSAVDWRTVGLDGHDRALADYRGKVVVLDF